LTSLASGFRRASEGTITLDMNTADEGSVVADRGEETIEQLTTEEMVALLSRPADAEFAYRVSRIYEDVERVYDASLTVGTYSASAASTNTR
jgi:hypothetical protein